MAHLRRERRLRSWAKHERMTVAMALAEQLHHGANRVEWDAALRRQTTRAREEEVREKHHALRGQTDLSRRCGRLRFRSRDRRWGSSGARGIGYELVLNTVVPQMAEQLVEVSLLALAVEYISPAPAVFQASSPVVEHHAPAPAVIPAPSPVVENIAPAPAVFHSPTPAVEIVAPAPGVACGGEYCTRAWCPSANACGGEYCTRASSSPCASACGEVLFTRASCVPVASARCGVSCTRASFVRIASARWVFSHLRQLCFVLEVFTALSQDRVPPLVVDMIFLSLLGADALRMRLAVCAIGMCTRARRDGRFL